MSKVSKNLKSVSTKELRVGDKIFICALVATISNINFGSGFISIYDSKPSDAISIHSGKGFTAIMMNTESYCDLVGFMDGIFHNKKHNIKNKKLRIRNYE